MGSNHSPQNLLIKNIAYLDLHCNRVIKVIKVKAKVPWTSCLYLSLSFCLSLSVSLCLSLYVSLSVPIYLSTYLSPPPPPPPTPSLNSTTPCLPSREAIMRDIPLVTRWCEKWKELLPRTNLAEAEGEATHSLGKLHVTTRGRPTVL